MYIVICLIGVFISVILLFREKAFNSSDIRLKSFFTLLLGTFVFCINDALWGCASTGLFKPEKLYVTIFSYLFHFCAICFSIIWFRYTILYVYSKKRTNSLFILLPLCLEIILLISNFRNKIIFDVGENGYYYVGPYRKHLFCLQFFFFVYAFFRALYLFIEEKDGYKRKRIFVVVIASLVPLIMGITLLFLPFVPCYSIGYMFSVLIIYVFNSTSDHARRLLQLDQENNLKKISDYETQLAEVLAGQNAVYFEMLKMQTNGMVAIDMDDNIIFINDAAARMFGFEDAKHFEGNALTFYEKSEDDNKVQFLESIKKLKGSGGKMSFEVTVPQPNGKKLHLLADIQVVTLQNGEKVGISSYTDITSYKNLEKELIYLSETDDLTKINNRRSGEQKAELLLLNGKDGMFCVIDVDKFKSINDKYGHSAGDKVLVSIADCMKTAFRDRDIIMRLGGDEFSVYAVGVKTEEVVNACVNRFFSEIDKITIPEITDHKITVSVGAVVCSSKSGMMLADYYKAADFALYKSKKIPGNRLEFYKFDELD